MFSFLVVSDGLFGGRGSKFLAREHVLFTKQHAQTWTLYAQSRDSSARVRNAASQVSTRAVEFVFAAADSRGSNSLMGTSSNHKITEQSSSVFLYFHFVLQKTFEYIYKQTRLALSAIKTHCDCHRDHCTHLPP